MDTSRKILAVNRTVLSSLQKTRIQVGQLIWAPSFLYARRRATVQDGGVRCHATRSLTSIENRAPDPYLDLTSLDCNACTKLLGGRSG